MTRDEILKELKLKRRELRLAVKHTGPGVGSTNAMYHIAAAINELTITTLQEQVQAEETLLAAGINKVHPKEESAIGKDPVDGAVLGETDLF
jgi:hypothetical protein